jgi:hypothetical protein
MESFKQLVLKHQDKFNYCLYGSLGIATMNTLARPDFNLILYAYIYYVWHMMSDSKVKL